MKKSKFIVLLLLFCLQPGFLAAQRAEAIRKDVLNPRLDKGFSGGASRKLEYCPRKLPGGYR